MSTTIHSRLRLDVPPSGVVSALIDLAPRHRWFLRHASQLGAAEPVAEYGLRGGYHFWSHFAPDPPPVLMTTLTGLQLPKAEDPTARMRYVWQHRGRVSEVELELDPHEEGSMLHLAHHGLRPLADEPLGGAAYWSVVLENMRLYLLGSDGLAFHYARSRGGLELGLSLVSAGLDATAAAWELLTTPTQLDRLWGRGAYIEPRVGGDLSFGWEGEAAGRILEFQAPRRDGRGYSARLSSVWQLAGDALPTVLSWSLHGAGSRTRLTIVHSGFGEGAGQENYLDTWRALLGRMQGAMDGCRDWEA
ncbi:SRPBCC domain-containing protein [bacterium]|nr:SRPBCC domain-containing protein [bacterium]